MIEQHLRPDFQALMVDPIAQWLSKYMNATQLTCLSAVMGVLVIPALFFGQNSLGILLLLLSGYCDTLDGSVARLQHKTSPWGTVIDIMADRLVEFAVILGLWSISPLERGFWALLMSGSILLCICSFLVVGIFSENQSEKSFHYSPGLMERAEAFIAFILMILWPVAFPALAAIFVCLVLFTAVNRLYQFYNLQHQPS